MNIFIIRIRIKLNRKEKDRTRYKGVFIFFFIIVSVIAQLFTDLGVFRTAAADNLNAEEIKEINLLRPNIVKISMKDQSRHGYGIIFSEIENKIYIATAMRLISKKDIHNLLRYKKEDFYDGIMVEFWNSRGKQFLATLAGVDDFIGIAALSVSLPSKIDWERYVMQIGYSNPGPMIVLGGRNWNIYKKSKYGFEGRSLGSTLGRSYEKYIGAYDVPAELDNNLGAPMIKWGGIKGTCILDKRRNVPIS